LSFRRGSGLYGKRPTEEEAMTTATVTVPRRESRGVNIALWALQALLALAFVSAGLVKLGGQQVQVDLFAEIGAGQWLRYVVGVLEVAGGVGVLVRRLSGLAALGLAGLMLGAVVTNVAVIGVSPLVPAAFLVLAALVAWGRRAETSTLPKLLRRSA
jgi:putative oxidoreductase